MNNIQLESYLKKYHAQVVCADDLPVLSIRLKNQIWIVNTDKCGGKGLHWVTFYCPKKGPLEFWDSLGYPPKYYHQRFQNILIASGSSYKYICSRLQAESSNVCGHYCIYFVLQRIKGRSMSDIVLDFNISYLYANDQLVYDFVNDVKK